jgi:Domain of unknown function (DUF5916)/Carbohydrate family 9 binding domain-like
MKTLLLAGVFVAAAAAVSAAHQEPVRVPAPAGQAPAAAAPPAAALDLNRIDPLTFKAMATRLPKGVAPRIDGRLTDEAWTLARPSGTFYQREPNPGMPSTERTEFRVLYDDRKIYFGVWAFDSDPRGIHASEMKRDSGLTKGDRIAIVVDTFNDRRNGFYFATNPLGAEKDAQYTDNARVRNNDWNAVWECRTSVDERGWYVEIAIPLSQLRFKRSPGESTWGLNVARSIIRKNEETYWVPYPRVQAANGFAYMSNAGLLLGLAALNPPRRLEFVPFYAPQVGKDVVTGATMNEADQYGFDARAGLGEAMMADLTYRTDFAQVEADQEVVNVSRFSLFFPEKRQFFTESAGLFNYGKPGVETGDFGPGLLPLFYSRRIGLYDGQEVPIIAGGRVTGRSGPYSVGVMNIETDRATVTPGPAAIEVPRANYSVVRVKRNVLSQSTVGGIFLNRQGGPGAEFNRTAGMDLNFVLSPAARLTGLLAKTFTPGVTHDDWAGAVDFAYQVDRYNCDLTYLDVGRAFNAEMGYIRRVDTRNARVKGAWTPRPRWRGVRQVSLGGLVDNYATHGGGTESRTSDAQFGVTFDDTSQLNADLIRDFDALAEPFRLGNGVVPVGDYRWTTAQLAYTSSPRHRVTGTGLLQAGTYYDGDKTTVSGSLGLLPVDTLLVELAYARNDIRLPATPAYVTNTLSTRVSYSFTPSLFVKGFVQYNDAQRRASLNLLLWSIWRPGSDFYIVYNQGWDTSVPGGPDARVRSRSLSVKVTYWLSR